MGIGFFEMVVLAVIALVVMGPEKFPDFAKIVIRTVRDLRGYVDDVKTDLAKELKPVKKELDKLSRYDMNTYLNTPDPKPAPTVQAAAAAATVDAQNVVDPAVVEERTPYEGPKHFEVDEAAPAPSADAPAAEVPVAQGESGGEGAPAAATYHDEPNRYPD